MKQTVQITLASIVAITLLTTGIVYANDDLMTEIEKAIEKLTKADKQQDKQIKKLNKQIKNLTSQIDELQQQHENQQDKIKRLKDFRDNALADMQTMHDDLDAIMNPVTTTTTTTQPTPEQEPTQEPIPTHAPITLNKTTVARGDNLELIMNFESIPQTIIVDGTVNDTTQQVNATLNYVQIMMASNDDGKYGAFFSYNASETERLYLQMHSFSDFKSINQTTYTFNMPIPYNHKTGSFDLSIILTDTKYVFKESGLKKDGSVWELDTFVTKPISRYDLYYEVT